MSTHWRWPVAVGWALALPSAASAGMPMIRLTDAAKLRLENISFFLFLFSLSAVGVWALWNYLRRDIPALPRLTLPRAFGLAVLWGALFVLVLTMISGARELLTPGAWEKQGLTYKVADAAAPAGPRVEPYEVERRLKLEVLAAALKVHAMANGGQHPADAASLKIDAEAWYVPGPAKQRYVYRPGQRVLLIEPEVFEEKRFVMLADGTVLLVEKTQLAELLRGGRP